MDVFDKSFNLNFNSRSLPDIEKLVRRLVLLSIFTCVVLATGTTSDYCEIQKEFCNFPHIGCDSSSPFEINPFCENIKIIPLSNRMKNAILKAHNDLRNKLAGGLIEGYPSASSMLEMFWDDELEDVAREHVKYCQYEHDKCRTTKSYRYPGQNLRRVEYTEYPQTNFTYELVWATNEWFDEYKDVEASIVDRYDGRKQEKQYGHFTVMSRDVNDRVGCAYITYEEERQGTALFNHLITCNYRETNIIGRPVYVRGELLSDCTRWGENYAQSARYPYLCTDETKAEAIMLEDEPVIESNEITTGSEYYCKLAKEKCGRKKHVGCDDDSGLEVNPNCANKHVVDLSANGLQDYIIELHNEARDAVASGNLATLPSASKMLKAEWDDELADVACAHAKHCQYQPDQCHATKSHNLPGQNLFLTLLSIPTFDYRKEIKDAIDDWFGRHTTVDESVIDAFHVKNYSAPSFGQFLHMIKEDNNKIGCCYLTFKQVNDPWYGSLITCDYRKANILTQPIYTKGEPASQCSDWGDDYQSSVDYPYLCERQNQNQMPIDTDTTTTLITTAEQIVETTINPDVTFLSDNNNLPFDGTTESLYQTGDFTAEEENELIAKDEMESSSRLSTSTTIDTVNDAKYKNVEGRFGDKSDFNLISSQPISAVDSSRNVTDYCEIEKEKCGGLKHIGCGTDFEFNPKCVNVEYVPFTTELKSFIITSHNKLRNKVASGTFEQFPSAAKMLEMEWDQELADVACEHTKFCQFKIDSCRATTSYSAPGQNIYTYSSSPVSKSSTVVLQKAVTNWFAGYSKTKPDIVDYFEYSSNATVFSHFTLMIKEHNNKLGCCFIKYNQQLMGTTWNSNLVTCNYRENNFLKEKTYTRGEPATGCEEWGPGYGPSKTWENLCAVQ